MKQLPGIFKNARIELKLREQHVITHLLDVDERIIFTPNQMSLESEAGKISVLTQAQTGVIRRQVQALRAAHWKCLQCGRKQRIKDRRRRCLRTILA